MKTLLFISILLCVQSAFSQSRRYSVSIPSLQCLKTTEDGEDEVYVLVFWQTSSGQRGSKRIPAVRNHPDYVDMNDGDHSNNRWTVGELLALDLSHDQWVDYFFAIMENDDGKTAQYSSVGRKIFERVDNGSTPRLNKLSSQSSRDVIAAVGRENNLSNTDDWIGAFAGTLKTDRNNVITNDAATKVSNPNANGEDVTSPIGSGFMYDLKGDGSHYLMTVIRK